MQGGAPVLGQNRLREFFKASSSPILTSDNFSLLKCGMAMAVPVARGQVLTLHQVAIDS